MSGMTCWRPPWGVNAILGSGSLSPRESGMSCMSAPGRGDMFSRYAACISEYPQADCPIFASFIIAYMDCKSAFMRRPSTGLRFCVYGGDRTNSH